MKLYLVLFIILISDTLLAVCNSATPGTVVVSSKTNYPMVCTSQWTDLGNNVFTGDSCTGVERIVFGYDNEIKDNGMMFCNGSDLISLSVTAGPICTETGKMRYVSGTSDLQQCSGANWYSMITSTLPSVTNCAFYVDQTSCAGDSECHWDGDSCESCPCNR